MTGVSDIVFVLEGIGWASAWRRLRLKAFRFLRWLARWFPARWLPARWLAKRACRFVVLCHQRTGSNLLCGRLSGHPGIIMHNELFNEVTPYTPHTELLGQWNVYERDRNPQGFLDHIFTVGDTDSTIGHSIGAVGFKSFPEHWIGRYGTFQRLVADPELKVIVLRRADPLAVLVSQRRANATQDYVGHGQLYDDVRVSVRPSDLQRYADKLDACYHGYEQLATEPLDITYEQLTRAPEATAARLCEFLHVATDPLGVPPHMTRQSNGKPRDAISAEQNLQLGFSFRHTRQSGFLHETAQDQVLHDCT